MLGFADLLQQSDRPSATAGPTNELSAHLHHSLSSSTQSSEPTRGCSDDTGSMASDRRRWNERANGGGGRPLLPAHTHPPSSSRQSVTNNSSNDAEPFSLTSLLGEATYKYVKMKDAENERKQMMDEWTKNEQYFNTHEKLRETFDGRRQKYESTYNNAREDYERAARQTEPLLRRIEEREELPKEGDIHDIVFQELKNLPRFVTLSSLKEQLDGLWRDVNIKTKNIEDTAYIQKREFERLSAEVKNMNLNPRSQHWSVLSETNFREVETRMQPKFDNVRKSLNNEVRSLSEKIDQLQKDTNAQPQRRIPLSPVAKAEDIIETAVEKAQEVLNDQYVNLHDLRLQVDSVLEGIRVLNTHIEEYDIRLDGLQSGTQKFLNQVKVENEGRNAVVVEALDKLHARITSELITKVDSSPATPASASFPSPFSESTRQNDALRPQQQQQQMAQHQQMAQQQQMAQLQQMAQQQQQTRPQSQPLVEIIANSVHVTQMNVQGLNNRVSAIELDWAPKRAIDEAIKQVLLTARAEIFAIKQTLDNWVQILSAYHNEQQKVNQTHDGLFRDTALHMHTVKRRFGEHRERLEEISQRIDKQGDVEVIKEDYDKLMELILTKMWPMLNKVCRQHPEIAEEYSLNVRSNPKPVPDAAASSQALARLQSASAAPESPTVPNDEQQPLG